MATISSLTIEKGPGRLRVAISMALWLSLALLILLIVVYMVVTSSGFIKRFILPRVSAAIHADVTVTDISVHPFSKITIRGLKVQAKDQEPLVTAPEIRARYSLWRILRGRLLVSDLTLVEPTVTLVENPDGTSNLDDLMRAGEKPPGKSEPPPAAKSSKPLQLDVRKVTVNNGTFRRIKNYAGNRHDSLEVGSVSVVLANLRNGQSGTLRLGALMQMENNPPTGRAGHLQAALNGDFSFTLSADLKPAPLTGQTRLDISRADGVFGDYGRFSAVLDYSVTPTEIKQLALSFQRAGVSLGQLAVSGPLDMEKMEGRLKVELRGIDRRLLNLAAATGGMDFGSTTISSSNDIELTRAGSVIRATGRCDAGNLQLTRAGQTTPTLNLNADYAVTVDNAARTLLVRGLNVTGTQNGNPLLAAHLARPMNLAWGEGTNGAGDSALDLTISDLNLPDWQPLLGQAASSGSLDLTLKLSSLKGGRQLAFDLDSQMQNLAAPLGGNRTIRVGVGLHARGSAVNLKQFNLAEYRVQVVRQSQALAVVTGSGTCDTANADLDLQVALQASFPALGQALQSDTSFTSGTAELQGRITQKQNTRTITGKLALANLNGHAGKSLFRNYSSTMALDLSQAADEMQIKQLNGQVMGNGSGGGHFEISGKYNTARQTMQLTADLSDFNQDGLRPFLEPLLADKQLASIALNGKASVDYDPKGSSGFKASLQVANLVVNDPLGQLPRTPLAAGLQMDASVKKSAADIREFQITLTPTKRAKNQIQLAGQVDYSRPDAIRGNLKLIADSLDVTSYYDLFAGGPKSDGKPAAAAPAGGTRDAGASQEPPAKILPLKNFTVTSDIGKLYLHEVEVTGWQTTANVDGGHVVVKPCKLALNGAPVSATVDLNLGVPGYRYDVAFGADRIPVVPLVDTFMPDRKGQMGGTLTANARIKGAGVTGASLQRNLNGLIVVGLTNLNLSVVNVRSAVLKKVINVVALIPQLLVNPQSAIASLLGQVTGTGGGLMEALEKSPIQIIDAQIKAGGGQIDLERALVESTAFKADAQGAIVLAQVLTNSTINIPVAISVSQSVARQLNLASGNATTNAAYVPLPQFLTMTGTVGDPKADINKLALGGMTVKSIGSGLINTATNGASQLGGFLNQLIKTVKPK